MAKAISIYGTQQTNETIRANVEAFTALHTNKNNDDYQRQYEAEKLYKHKLRMIDSWRRQGKRD